MQSLDKLKFQNLSDVQANEIKGGRWKVYATQLIETDDGCNTKVFLVKHHLFGDDEYKENDD